MRHHKRLPVSPEEGGDQTKQRLDEQALDRVPSPDPPIQIQISCMDESFSIALEPGQTRITCRVLKHKITETKGWDPGLLDLFRIGREDAIADETELQVTDLLNQGVFPLMGTHAQRIIDNACILEGPNPIERLKHHLNNLEGNETIGAEDSAGLPL